MLSKQQQETRRGLSEKAVRTAVSEGDSNSKVWKAANKGLSKQQKEDSNSTR
jgi:hypothetical protein